MALAIEVEANPGGTEIIPRFVGSNEGSIDPVRVVEEDGRVGHLRKCISKSAYKGEGEAKSKEDSLHQKRSWAIFANTRRVSSSLQEFRAEARVPGSIHSTVGFSDSRVVVVGPWRKRSEGHESVSRRVLSSDKIETHKAR